MKRITAATVAVALPLMMAACTPSATEEPSPAEPVASSTPVASGMDQMLPPTTVAPADLAGTEVRVIRGTSLVLEVPDGTEADWTGTTADVAIAEFSPGGPSEGAVFRPGFVVRELGTTDATVTGPDDQTIAFSITVVEY